ncbi:hypothetical protein J4558_23480 [Leptolyngbya sp. 15MV]|nr:hypothetical protein J4558_23480 [Leptolyngbya sp. 15MV]
MRRSIALACLALCSTPALAQEAMFGEAATMPGPGTVVLRQMLHLNHFGSRPEGPEPRTRSTRQIESITSLQVGLVRDLSLRVELPMALRRTKDSAGAVDNDQGVEDIDLLLKWRVLQHDKPGLDTTRLALLAGATIASGDDRDFSSGSVNPQLGAVLTTIRGRHGFNQEITYRFNTGGDDAHNFGGRGKDDALTLVTGYVYRLWPDRFADGAEHGWYATAELITLYETSGDWEGRLAIGAMLEARTCALEASVLLPVFDRLRRRAELDWGLAAGLRLTF